MTPRQPRPIWTYLPTALLTLGFVLLVRHFANHSNLSWAGANVWEVADWICMDGLEQLTNILAAGNLVNTDFQPDFEKEFPIGDTARVPLPVMATIRNGLGYVGAPVINKHTTVTASEVFGTDFDVDSVEQALRVGRSRDYISEKVIKPHVAKIAQEWEQRVLRFAALNCPNITGALGTDPTSFDATTTTARQMIVELGGWDHGGEAGVLLPPSVMRNLRTNFATAFNPQDDMSKAFRTGIYKRADDFDIYESMSLLSFTSGTWAAPGSLTVKTAVADGDTSIVLNCTTGDSFVQGDIMSFPASFRVNTMTKSKVGARTLSVCVASPTTGAASAATVPISIGPYGFQGPGNPYQNVDVLPAVNAVVTMFPGTTLVANTAKTGNQAIAMNKMAMLLIGIPLEVPKYQQMAAQKRDDNTGIPLRLVKSWDPIQSRMIHRLDTCGGFGVGYTDSSMVRILCA